MLESILSFIINLFFWLVGLIGSVIMYPIQLILIAIIPGLGDFIPQVLNFLDNYIFNYLSFIKELVLDYSCLPRELWLIFVGFLVARFTIAPSVRAIKLIINMWKIKSGGDTK